MATEMETAIEDNATGPKRAQADGISTEQHSLQDQIAADKYLTAKGAVSDPRKAFRLVQIVPPGAS